MFQRTIYLLIKNSGQFFVYMFHVGYPAASFFLFSLRSGSQLSAARPHTSCNSLSLSSSPSAARLAGPIMRRHIVEPHLSPHHHPVRTESGWSALPCAYGNSRRGSQSPSVDAGSANIHVCGTPRGGVADVGAEGNAWRGRYLRRTPISE